MSSRLLPPHLIPASLWDSTKKTLFLPEALAKVYVEKLSEYNLLDLAQTRNRAESPVGGLTQEETDEHFAQAFDGSAARAQLAVLDPRDELPEVSDTFVSALAGNDLCMIDVPCGSGASMYSFLLVIAQLRAAGVLPRSPLNVTLIASDASAPARANASDIFQALRGKLESEAIFATPFFPDWDATDKMSTTVLIQEILGRSVYTAKRLLIVSNFSAFLSQKGKLKQAEPQLGELFRFSSGPGCKSVWIEPNTNNATHQGGILLWVAKQIASVWKKFTLRIGSRQGSVSTHYVSKAKFAEPLSPNPIHSVQIAVIPIPLERQP